MDEVCAQQLASRVVKEASAALAYSGASPGQKEKAFSFVLGIRWAEDLIKTVSDHAMCGIVGRGLANPTTNEMARKLRAGPHEAWSALGGQVDADSSSWRTYPEERGTMDEASRQGWAAVVTRLQDCLIFNPKELSDARWGFMSDMLEDDERKQLTLK